MSHAELSPSSAHRWMSCPGSVRMSRGIARTSSVAADAGTAAHERAAGLLTHGAHGHAPHANDEDVMGYANRVNARAEGGHLWVEHRLAISNITTEHDAHGTADAVTWRDGVLTVADLKTGRFPVSASENQQLLIYAAAADEEFSIALDTKEVCMVIDQPTLGVVDEWRISVDELRARVPAIRKAGELALSANAPLKPSETACRWCPAKANCPALAQEVARAALIETPENLAQAMASVGVVEVWAAAVRDAGRAAMLSGQAIEGWKLVQGRQSNRKWLDEDKARAFLGTFLPEKSYTDNNLCSPTAVEKFIMKTAPDKKAQLQEHIHREPGGLVVAPTDDKREAVTPPSQSIEFTDLTKD